MMNWLFRRRPPFGASRALRPADAAPCAELHRLNFAHPWSVQEFEALLADPACSGEAIEAKFGLGGFALSRRALDEAEVLSIVVDFRLRRRGGGQRLMAAHLARLAALGVKTLFLEVDEQNEAALALYRRQGFVEKGSRKAYYARPDGTRANARVMARALS